MSSFGNVGRRRTRCPRCDVPLAPVKSGESLLTGCPKCHGVWLDRKMFDALSKRDSQPRRFGAARDARNDRSIAPQTVKCPICFHWMDAKNFENCPGLVVDVCRRHGTWLDTNELQTILNFVKQRNAPPSTPTQAPLRVPAISPAATLAGAATATVAASAAVPSLTSSEQHRSVWEQGGQVVLELLDLVDIGDIGDLVSGVAEIGFSLFDGL
jgi:Zn-finger nucleic acid-binding protein